jgi:hypothetical protein
MNKLKVLFTTMAVLLASSTFAQLTTKYRLGIYGSLNFNKLTFEDDVINSNYRPGFGFGLLYDKFFAENYAFSTGLDIRQQRANFSYFAPIATGSDQVERREVDLDYSYVQVPLAIKMHVNEFYFFTPFVRFGGTLGIARKSSADVISDSGTEINRLTRDFLMSFMLSLGTYYQIGEQTQLYFCFDFNRSLLNNVDKDRITQIKNEQPRFSWFTFSTGLTF